MKIIRKSNFDHEDHRGDQRVVAAVIAREREAKVMCDALNADATGVDPNSDDWFVVKPDDYVLPPAWEP